MLGTFYYQNQLSQTKKIIFLLSIISFDNPLRKRVSAGTNNIFFRQVHKVSKVQI